MLATLYDSISKSHFPADFAAQKESPAFDGPAGHVRGELGGVNSGNGIKQHVKNELGVSASVWCN